MSLSEIVTKLCSIKVKVVDGSERDLHRFVVVQNEKLKNGVSRRLWLYAIHRLDKKSSIAWRAAVAVKRHALPTSRRAGLHPAPQESKKGSATPTAAIGGKVGSGVYKRPPRSARQSSQLAPDRRAVKTSLRSVPGDKGLRGKATLTTAAILENCDICAFSCISRGILLNKCI